MHHPSAGNVRPNSICQYKFHLPEKIMRLFAFILALLVGDPAVAQSWKEYAYPNYAVAISFPAEPEIQTTTYQAADGRAVEAHVYSVIQNDAAFRLTIVEASEPAMEESAVIDHAVKTLSQGGEIKVDIPARVSRVYGRQISIVGADGSHSSAAVFYHKGRLYQIEGKVFPNGSDMAAIRFQQSLVFTGGESNRSADAAQDRAGRERRRACRGGAENGGAPAVADDAQSNPQERCRRGGR
jgi:hypothetical protein